MHLLVFAFHRVKLESFSVDDVGVVALVAREGTGGQEVIQGRIVDELTETEQRGDADGDIGALGEAGLGEETLGGDFSLKELKEARTAEDHVRLAAITLQLTDFLTETFDDVRLTGGVGERIGAILPQLLATKGGVTGDTTGGTNVIRGSGLDESLDTSDLLGVRTIGPEHRVETTSPAFSHVIKLSLEDVRQDSSVTATVLAGAFTSHAVRDGDAIDLQLSQGDRDAGMDFLPRIGDTLGVLRVGVVDSFVTLKALDGGGVVENDRDRDVAFAARERLLLTGHKTQQRLLLDGLSERIGLDVEIKGRSDGVFERRKRISHVSSAVLWLYLKPEPHNILKGAWSRTGVSGRQRAGRTS